MIKTFGFREFIPLLGGRFVKRMVLQIKIDAGFKITLVHYAIIILIFY